MLDVGGGVVAADGTVNRVEFTIPPNEEWVIWNVSVENGTSVGRHAQSYVRNGSLAGGKKAVLMDGYNALTSDVVHWTGPSAPFRAPGVFVVTWEDANAADTIAFGYAIDRRSIT